MKKLSQGIANWLCRCKELSEFSAEIQYAVHQILWDLSTLILSLICLQLIYSDIQSGLLFAALFLPLHCVAGGAHAQTRLNCVGITILMFIICAYYCHEDTMPFITILSMLSWLFIWKFASTAAQNHIMTIRQKKKNRKLTHHILLLLPSANNSKSKNEYYSSCKFYSNQLDYNCNINVCVFCIR